MANKKRKTKNNYKILFLLGIIIIGFFIIINQSKNKSNKQLEKTEINNLDNETISVDIKNSEENKPSVVQSLSAEEIKQSKERGLPVLMYHFFYDETAGETGRDNNFIEIHDFEEQIKYLAENNYYVPTWDEVLGYINNENGLPLKSIVITVDDGDESFFRLAKPILEKYNFKATSFVITSWYGSSVAENQSPSIDFQSHSDNMHISGSDGKGAFLTISYEDACADLETSRSILGGQNCKVFCYPFGHFNDRCKKILKDCNYTLAFTTQGGRVFPGDDQYELPRVRMSKGDSLNSFINKVK
ncbi:MAG: polysaccharide deacetylase family protein [Clostridia bacterium]|nr:polysaccharide deacetylase family protein [Clostridia bacterium]